MAKNKVLICPYCGETQAAEERCRYCGGLFEPLSRQATHNEMGPWFIRDENRPFQPGCSYETLIRLVERGQVTKYAIIRSPTTKQFWTVAKRVPGIAHLLGYCHNCDASVDPGDHGCHACGVPFGAYLDRNYLGLPDVRPLPWEAGAEEAQQSAPASQRMMEFRRAAEPMGISSFASDADLRGAGLTPMPVYAHAVEAVSQAQLEEAAAAELPVGEGATPTGPAHRMSPRSTTSPQSQVQERPVSAISAVLEASPAGVAARAMQRRLDAQRRTIRTLVIASIVLGAIVIVCLAAIIIANKTAPADGAAPNANQGQVSPNPAPSPTSAIHGKGPKHAAAASTPDAAASTSAKKQAETEPVDFQAQYTHARELIAEADRTDRALADRIEDYQQAQKILKSIAADAPDDAKPEGLADQIKQVDKALERLRLQEFFP